MLEERGEVSRNQALGVFISRLASRIGDLEEKGWKFRTEKRGGDFVYIVSEAPKQKELPLDDEVERFMWDEVKF